MPLDFKRARQLCTEREFNLVEATRSEPLASLTPQRLQAKIARSRVLRGKFRDLADRQRREERGKIAPRGRRAARGNARTVEKAELFAEVLRRFEARAQKLAIVALAPTPGREKRRREETREKRPSAEAYEPPPCDGRTRADTAEDQGRASAKHARRGDRQRPAQAAETRAFARPAKAGARRK